LAALPANESRTPVTPKEVHGELKRLLRDRRHMDLRNPIGNIALETRNPFQQANRRPKRWIGAAGRLLMLASLIADHFDVG